MDFGKFDFNYEGDCTFRLKSTEEIKNEFGDYWQSSHPTINHKMKELLGKEHLYYMVIKKDHWAKTLGWGWRREWFEWIKDEKGELIYGKESFASEINTYIENILEEIL